jgi:hypothetical protein
LEKDNFAGKFAKAKEIVKICIVRIEKKKCEHKKSRKIKITLFSLECSISFGEKLNSHMHFPIFPYPFQMFWPRYTFLQISLDSFD